MSKIVRVIKKAVPQSVKVKIKDEMNKQLAKQKVDIYKVKYPKLNISNPKKVSVVIPNYNYSKYIIERIDSILLQTYPVYELIILDDCSTDDSVKVIENKIKTIEDVKVTFIKNKENSHSVFSQWQKGFKAAKGDYVWIAEADDSCDPRFLEKNMQGFKDNVVMSYSESKRIDETNHITGSSCRDWFAGIDGNHWAKDFIHNGKLELQTALYFCNTIPNVSAVVFKNNPKMIDYIENAKQFRISGDWYVYFQLLQTGDVAYSASSYNYFRKHKGSESTDIKKSIELKECLTIQKMIRETVTIDSRRIEMQKGRYGGLLKQVTPEVINEVQSMLPKHIAWIIPEPIKGAGGIRTIIQNANYLVKKGYICDIYMEENYKYTNEDFKNKLVSFYGECLCNAYVGIDINKHYDLVFATASQLTPEYVCYSNALHKAYFVQDFEPWFEPMGGEYITLESTYKLGLQGISIGKWLTHKLSTEYNMSMNYFDFCADLNVYKKLNNVKKEKAICFIHQPEKSRRCAKIGLNALLLVKKLMPDVKIYLYGSNDTVDDDIIAKNNMINLHTMPIDKCNELYNKCTVGLCISASNPSRIPFEMMASGLPVVDVYRENNLYDMPEDGILLADATSEAIASALIKVLKDTKLQKEMSINGNKYMQDYPLEKGFEQFGNFVDNYINDKKVISPSIKKLYTKEPVMPSKDILAIASIIKPKPIPRKNTGKTARFIVKARKYSAWKIKLATRKLVR